MAGSSLPRRARRTIAALAVATVAAAGALSFAAPAQAFTTRVETVTHNFGDWLEVVELPNTVTVTAGSTLRVARRAGFDSFGALTLSKDGAEDQVLYSAQPVPGTTTAWNVGLPGVAAGTYEAQLELLSPSGGNVIFYVFDLVVQAGTPATVKVPLTGSSTRYLDRAVGDSWVLGGSRLTVVAPPGISFKNASVAVGVPDEEGGSTVDTPSPDDLAVTKVSSGTSLSFRVPSAGITDETWLAIEITVPNAPTLHGTGTVILAGRLIVDPVGTPWSAPEGIGTTRTDTIYGGMALTRTKSLVSRNGTYRLAMQGNSNLVLWKGSKVLWQTGQKGAQWTELNGDGNLIQRNASGAVVWQTARYGARQEAKLVVQNDGNVVIYGAEARVVWASGTTGR